jgi:long-chain fatty acid transport protein
MVIVKWFQKGISLALVGLMSSQAGALGGANIGNEVSSARSAGQGYTGIAGQNDDPTVVWSNPGAITNLSGTQITVGTHWENIHGQYESNTGAESSAKVVNAIVPNFSMTQSFLDGKLGAGLTVQSPFGLETHWPDGGSLGYVATNSRLRMTQISPAIAYQVHSMVSIGAGVDYANLFDAQLDRNVNIDGLNSVFHSNTSGTPDGVSSLKGQATQWGYHAGLLFQPTEKHAIGATYHSMMKMRINGNLTLSGLTDASAAVFGGSRYSTSAYTDLTLPENVQLGYAYKPTEKWLLEADAAWYHWSANRDLNVRYSETDPTRLAVLNTGNPAPLDLRDAWSISTGANYKVSDTWQVRGGFWYEPWAQPESTFNPAFNDLSRYGISTGAGYSLSKNLTIDAAYSAVFFHNRHINNTVGYNTTGNPAVNISGTYKDFANLFAFNLKYHFGGEK